MNKKLISIVFIALSITVVSQAEQIKNNKNKHSEIFADKLATTLASKVKKRDIKKIEDAEIKALAEALYNNAYATDYRVAQYKAILSPTELGRQLHIGNGYSNYEGITGIYLEKGEQTIIVDNLADNKNVKLIIPNWNRRAPEGVEPTKDPNGWGIIKEEYPLVNGFNELNIKKEGLAYIYYYSDKPEQENEIAVHFVNDKVNGYFDVSKHNDTDWDNLLENAVSPVIDAKGDHIQIVYPVEACKKYAAGRGVELLSNYDSLVRRQYRFIGLEKYNKIPKNKILARVNYNYYMFRDGDGVAYMGGKPGYAMHLVVDPSRVISGDPCWGFSHEVGHVHQLRPYLNWGGLGETSNNIVTMYVTSSFGIDSRLSAQNNYEKARKSIIDNKISYLEDSDVFNRLVPFWQLELYFSQNGHKDFYADLHEVLRQNATTKGDEWDDRGANKVADYQLNFVRTVCEVAQLDLTDFFDKWGFFNVGEFELNDYGKYQYKMTEEMVDNTKQEIAQMNLKKPTQDITTYQD